MTRTAIVTGASGGIGQGIAERLAKDGFSIVVHYAGNRAKAEDTVKRIEVAAPQSNGTIFSYTASLLA
jgi:3-oxoacyl-[acyl-carrier protein] reductase